MRSAAGRIALAVLLALAATGCALTKPTLAFKSARATEIDFDGANLEVVFALKNPNPLSVSLASVSYRIEVEGHPVVSGSPKNGLHVPAQGETNLVFPTRVRFQDVVPVVQTLLTKEQASYRASGTVGVQTPMGVVVLPLSTQGTFPVPKLPQVAFRPPRVEGLSLEGARVVFPLQITNRNPFPLPLGGLSASVAINGASIGTVQVTTPATLAANQGQVLELPLQVSFLQSGFAVAQAIQSKQAHVKLDGQLKSGTSVVPIALSENLSFR